MLIRIKNFKKSYNKYMANIVPIALTIAGFYLFFYLSGMKGLIIIGILLAIFMGLVYFKQNMLLYMPVIPGLPKSPSQNPARYRHPLERNLESVDLALNTSDGVIIRGWHVKSPQRQRILIYFHQNAGNIGTRIDYVKYLCAKTNSDVILVAYRGYSDSQSIPHQNGLMLDSYAIMEYAISYSRDNNNTNIYVLGRSLGGAVSINLATQQLYKTQIKGLILQNTFTSIGDMVDALFPALKYFKFLQRNFWPSIDRIQHIQIPILFIKSVLDQIVPHQQMNILMNTATTNKKYQYKLLNGTHNSSWDIQPQKYFGKLVEFFKNVENQTND